MPHDLPSLLLICAVVSATTLLRYLLVAGGAWLLAYVLFARRWAARKIIAEAPMRAEIRREITQSLRTIVVFATVGCLVALATLHGWTLVYPTIDAHGWPWFWASIALAVVLHDTYFYWTHRLMHHPRLYRRFHLPHHRSTNPTPWAAYSFSLPEALVEVGILPLLVFTLPLHPLALMLFLLWQMLFNVIGHTGFEHTPRWVARSPLRLLINTPTGHIMHHQRVHGNFGLYFAWWDRLLGTTHADYDARLLDLTAR